MDLPADGQRGGPRWADARRLSGKLSSALANFGLFRTRNSQATGPLGASGQSPSMEQPTDGGHPENWRRRAFDDGPIGVAVIDSYHRLADTNLAFRHLVRTASAPEGAPLSSLLRLGDGTDFGPALDQTQAGQSLEVILRQTDPVGEECTADLYPGPVEDGFRVVHLVDTTRQKKLELQFTQSQKMLAVGKLAGGIAHDFNNLLTAMNGFCDLLLLRHQAGDPSFADIMQIKQNANRAANLVRQLLAFSRQQTLQPQVLNLADVMFDLSNLLRRLLGAGVELRVNHAHVAGMVLVDRVQLEQVLINLAVNGRDAMHGDGVLTIQTRDIRPEEANCPPRNPPLPAAEWVLIEVTDTGPGIPPENLDRIFDPFFTTKPLGEGTGLGLSTVYGIVKQTGGYIYAANRTDGGACFSVYLPLHHRHKETDDDPATSPASDLSGAGTILLVEDEDPVRLFASRALRSKGYRVLEARTGVAALAVLEDGEEKIDLVVTDVVMPEMDGPALIARAREADPSMRIICVSGYAEESFRDQLSSFRNIHLLPKPFTLSQLAERVQQALGSQTT